MNNINVLSGTGNLYWAGGMRNSWNEALKNDYDGYLLLNDDTFVFENLFLEILKGIDFCIKNFNKNGILIGSTQDAITKKLTYGGSVFTNKLKGAYKMLIPTMNYQECQLGNANIMFVHKDVVNNFGILSDKYTHGVADYDYTFYAYLFETMGFKTNRKLVKKIVRGGLYWVLAVVTIVWQIVMENEAILF